MTPLPQDWTEAERIVRVYSQTGSREELHEDIAQAIHDQRHQIISAIEEACGEELERHPEESYLAHRDQWNGGSNSLRSRILDALKGMK